MIKFEEQIEKIHAQIEHVVNLIRPLIPHPMIGTLIYLQVLVMDLQQSPIRQDIVDKIGLAISLQENRRNHATDDQITFERADSAIVQLKWVLSLAKGEK